MKERVVVGIGSERGLGEPEGVDVLRVAREVVDREDREDELVDVLWMEEACK